MKCFEEGIFNLAAIVGEVADRDPERVAVIESEKVGGGERTYRRFTYRQLSADAEALAVRLREIGIGERTRTVFMASPSFEAAVALVALTRVGATLVMIDPSVGYRNVGERLRRVGPEAFVGLPMAHAGRLVFGWGPRVMRRAITVGGYFPGTYRLGALVEAGRKVVGQAEPGGPAVTGEDTAAILYTTGSTGPAKPTEYLHKTYVAVHRTAHVGWGSSDREEVQVDLVAFPAFMSVAFSYGGTCVVPPINFARQGPADVDPAAMIEVINACGVRTFFASPALLGRIAEYANRHDVKMPSLIRGIGGGAPLFPPLMQALVNVMGEGAEVCANYGATEALPSTELSSSEVLAANSGLTLPGRGICVGRPFAGVKMRVVPVVDGVMERTSEGDALAFDELGELIVSGPNISPRYFGEPESTAKNKTYDEDGVVWHRLGDVGVCDVQGRFWVAGRVGHRVRTVDGVLSPMHAETILDTHPAVLRSGLVGVPDLDGKYQVAVACIELCVPKNAAEKKELEAELLAMLERYPQTRAIKHVLFADRLPVDPRHNAKIERPQLGKWAAAQLSMKLATKLAEKGAEKV